MLTHSLETKNWRNQFWYSTSDFFEKKFGEKVYKVTVSAGFTCPTRDGTRGKDGCSFCDERGSSSFFSSGNAGQSIRMQLDASIPSVANRFGAKKFLAYFQSFTNTYGPIEYLREVYDGAINVAGVEGLAIGTRPDCISGEVLELLNGYGNGRFVSLELGLQSLRDEALLFYERGHTAKEGIDGIKRALRFPNLHVVVHLMFGAPGDTVEDAIHAAKVMSELGVHGVKIHQLMILENTKLAKMYKENPWPLLTIEQYNEMAIAFLENLSPNIHIERTHALSSHPEELVGPEWSAGRFNAFNKLKNQMFEQGRHQGRLVE